MKKHHWFLAAILFLIFILRLPSLFEPFWYGDEGIFAAVARNLNLGGVLYETAWDNKPPMIYLTYQFIFNFFGVSMFWLRLIGAIAVLATSAVIYEIAQGILGTRRALVATIIFGLLTSLRLVEGNLALTELFMILPISLAMLLIIKRNFDYKSLFFAGVLFAIASLYKQVGALEAAALGTFVFLNEKNFVIFIKRGLVLSLGFALPFLVTLAYFAPKNLVDDYIFAAYTYYQIYLEESPQYAILVNVSKLLPIVATILYGLFKKYKTHDVSVFHLILLWSVFSFLGSYFSGRTYGHYLVQAIPAVSLLIASISVPFKFNRARVVFAVCFLLPLLFLTRLFFSDFLSGGPINQIKYYKNFIDYAYNRKGLNEYNDFFDRNVNTIMGLSDALRVNGAISESIYIWGDYPWLYAIVDAKNPSKYVTSFHVFGVPNGREEVARDINKSLPKYIIKPDSSIGYFLELENIINSRYTHVAKIEAADLYLLKM